ncbi:hypothetical protein Tco_0503424 [Tanacetum coccineum]
MGNTQAMIEADRLLAERLQTREREELTDEDKAKLFVEFIEKRRKHFAALRAQEKRNRPPTKAQKRSQMSTYLKHMEIAQDNSAKRAGDKLESDKSNKQKIDKHEEVEVDDEAKLKKHMEIVKDDDIAIDAIPLANKPPVIVEYKIGIDREDLQTLWKLVKTKHGDTRPEDEHERVLLGDLKVMFEPDIKSDVWRNLQGYTVTIWKLFDSCRVHVVRNLKIQKMNIKFRGGLLGLKDFKMILRVITAQLVMLIIKLQLLSNYNCWKDYADRDEMKDISKKR